VGNPFPVLRRVEAAHFRRARPSPFPSTALFVKEGPWCGFSVLLSLQREDPGTGRLLEAPLNTLFVHIQKTLTLEGFLCIPGEKEAFAKSTGV